MTTYDSGTKIIGGMFGLEETTDSPATKPPFLNGSDILLANGRSGINLLVRLLSPGAVWLPSYLCEVVVEAVRVGGVPIHFYPVGSDLAVSALDWIADVEPGDLIVFVDYFGFPLEETSAELTRQQGAWVLEDASQALLSGHVGQFSDFVLFSPRKFIGVPDGGILSGRQRPIGDRIVPSDAALEGGFARAKLEYPPIEWWSKALTAGVLRREFDIRGGDRHWFDLFQETEQTAPIGRFAMSEFTRMLISHNIDYETIARRRTENYQVLAQALPELAIYPSLLPGVVPLGFPVRVKERDRVLRKLFDHQIYPPVHWRLNGAVPERFEESHRLSAQIMTLPCDQRYDPEDMERIIRCLKEIL